MYEELKKQLKELGLITEFCGEQRCFECKNKDLCDKYENKMLSDVYKNAARAIERLELEVAALKTDKDCMYQHDVDFDACHICNNERDMYRKKPSNFDKICAMTYEELAEFLTQDWYDGPKFYCPVQIAIGEDECAKRGDCRQCWLDWLKQEAE